MFYTLLLLNDPQEMTDALTEKIKSVAEEVLGVRRYKRQLWVPDGTLLICGSRRKKKPSRLRGETPKREYKSANNMVRSALHKDEKIRIENQSQSI